MYHKYFRIALAAIFVFCTFQMAVAEDKVFADTCFPLEGALERVEDAGSLDADRRDTVDTFLQAYFVDVETRKSPMTLYLKYEETRDSFAVNESGEVKGFHHKISNAPNEAIICGTSQEEGKIGLGMSTSVRFKSNSGVHTLSEILDGVRDGKRHHKKNLGGVQAMFVPKMTHIAIIYDDVETLPNVSAISNGESISVELEPYGEMLVIDVEALAGSNVETLTVEGGAYELFPVPSIKKMKSLGIK